MKKPLLLFALCLMSLTMQAQRCAVLEFRAGVGISQADVDGLSAIFITYFRPAGYTMVERTQIDKAIDEQGFQRSSMTENQMVRIGQILNVSKVVVGDVNIVMGQYNVDTRVINVETGTIAATEGTSFTGSSYRTTMQSLAERLAAKIAIAPGSTVPSPTATQGYTDLGLPSGTLWKNFNAAGFYTYDEAVSQFGSRLPSKAQWEELKAECQWSWTGNGYIVTGPNANSISLPASGFRSIDGHLYQDTVGISGAYWSSTSNSSENAWYIYFYEDGVDMLNFYREAGYSVRLVQN